LKFINWFKSTLVPPIPQAEYDPLELERDQAEAAKQLVTAERQAFTARIAVNELRQVNLRNGFAPAIEASIKRKLGEAN
jgi:hypothetical protein